jgi:SAM-dependent methyltransferase
MTYSWDAYGEALQDYYYDRFVPPLLLNTSYGARETMPPEVFFRDRDGFSELESYALSLANGSILDVGAGAGAFTLYLQKQGFDVVANEISSIACEIMRSRGVKNVNEYPVQEESGSFYDTILLMMNGLGLFGTLNGLREGLMKLRELLTPGGQIVADSSDIRYLYESALPEERYHGEIDYQYFYQGRPGEWFKWVYVDQKTLKYTARQCGLHCQVVFEDENDHYLVIMKPE